MFIVIGLLGAVPFKYIEENSNKGNMYKFHSYKWAIGGVSYIATAIVFMSNSLKDSSQELLIDV